MFSDRLELDLWPALASVYKQIDAFLASVTKAKVEKLLNTPVSEAPPK